MASENHKSNDSSINFMLEEFRFLKSSFEGAMTWRDERFKNFVNIIFGTIALLAVASQLSNNNSELVYAIIFLSGILYLYGLFVFSRLVAGSFVIEQYKYAINRVRKYFVDLDKNIKDYLEMPIETPKPVSKKRKLGSGLLGITAFTNSLLMLGFGTALIFEITEWQIITSTVIGILLAFFSWGIHAAYYNAQTKKNIKKD